MLVIGVQVGQFCDGSIDVAPPLSLVKGIIFYEKLIAVVPGMVVISYEKLIAVATQKIMMLMLVLMLIDDGVANDEYYGSIFE